MRFEGFVEGGGGGGGFGAAYERAKEGREGVSKREKEKERRSEAHELEERRRKESSRFRGRWPGHSVLSPCLFIVRVYQIYNILVLELVLGGRSRIRGGRGSILVPPRAREGRDFADLSKGKGRSRGEQGELEERI